MARQASGWREEPASPAAQVGVQRDVRQVLERVIRAPRMHFVDSGLVCHLLGIHEPGQLPVHPLRGALFESWVASDFLDGLRAFADRTAESVPHLGITPRLVYGGERSERRTGASVVPWRGVHDLEWD